jgi:hypothetical protein
MAIVIVCELLEVAVDIVINVAAYSKRRGAKVITIKS